MGFVLAHERNCRIFRTFLGSPDASGAPSQMNILVTGATGAIGADLLPRLVASGHAVRAFARDPSHVTASGVHAVVRGDAVTGAGLDEALAGIDVAYFLIHSMEASAAGDGGGFAGRDRRAAEQFAAAARAAGVRRVVYLGGLVPEGAGVSPHLASRLEVEEALLAGAPGGGAARAAGRHGGRARAVPVPLAPRRGRAGVAVSGLGRQPPAA